MLRRTTHHFLLAVLLLSACSGCRLWSVNALPVGDRLSETMLDAMRQKLVEDNWQPNANWSVLNVGFHRDAVGRSASTRRWVYGSRIVDDVINELDTARQRSSTDIDSNDSQETTPSQTTNASERREHWDGFWPLNVDQVLNTLDVDATLSRDAADSPRLGTHYLRRIAREDSKSGWNAAILLAQRDPQSAREFLPVLERLVVSYPRKAKPPTARPEPADTAVVENKSANEPENRDDESIESIIERVAGKLQDDLNQETKTSDDDQKKEDSQSDQMLAKLLDRVKDASPLKKEMVEQDDQEKISTAMRAAAAEAWCLALASAGDDPHEQLAPAGRVLERADLPNLIRSELYRGVARQIAPALIPRLSNAMRVSDEGQRVPLVIRLAAIESCLIHAMMQRHVAQTIEDPSIENTAYDESLWPATILNCGTDSDATIRRTFGRWVAVARYHDERSDAVAILTSQLRDHQSRVRLEALKSLGWLGTPAARATLQRFANRPEAIVRAAAIEGLARWGADELAPRVTDDSSFVRLAVTRQLAEQPSARSYFLLQQLLADDDLQVQAAAVEGIATWPDDPALTLLLTALRDSSGPTRRLAFQQLRNRRPVRDAFAKYDSPRREERVFAVDELRAKLDVQPHFSNQFSIDNMTGGQSRGNLFVQDVESLLNVVTDPASSTLSPQRAEAVQRLKQLHAEDIPIVEQYLQKHPDRDLGFIEGDLLPQLSPAHEALFALHSTDLQRNRNAAETLRQLSTAGTLSPYVIRRLLPHLNGRQDLLVWRSAMAAVMPDSTDVNAQVALRALNDERADVRLLGIEFIERHPQPQYARWLQQLRLFDTVDKRVRLAAIAAASRCGNLSVVTSQSGADDSSGSRDVGAGRLPGLRSLLTHADADTRIAAVIALSHLGDEQGMQELARLVWSPEPKTRLAAVRAMGETNSTWFIEPLIRRGWTERHVDVRRGIMKSLDQLTLPGKRPADLLDEIGYDAKIRKWLKWLEESHRPRLPGRIEN